MRQGQHPVHKTGAQSDNNFMIILLILKNYIKIMLTKSV